jgi:CIC family chloride channel protein
MVEEREERDKPLGPLIFSISAVLIGIGAGLGAVAFRGLIALFHNLFFLGTLSLTYDANVHTPAGPLGPYIILVPALVSILVVSLINIAPEAKGTGIPEVMDAISYKRGVIRPVVSGVKALASSLSIGSGGSVGREGPITQIGSSLGSVAGQIFSLPPWQRVTLIACGAGGGIAATYNTPVGGVLFAVEILLDEVSARTLIPLIFSAASAAFTGRFFFGAAPSFIILDHEAWFFHGSTLSSLLACAGLGIVAGLASTLFIRSVYGVEDFFDNRVKGGAYSKHMIGMLLVGVIMYVMMSFFGRYYIEGVGYATVQDVLAGNQPVLGLLFLLFALKLLATSVTLGSGGSGGIFSPALFMGATLGGAYGSIMHLLFPALAPSPAAYAVAGMAGLTGSVTGAPLAAIVMIFEMTLNYAAVIPITITVAISYEVRKIFLGQSMYTLKLARRGHALPEALYKNYPYTRRAAELMETNIQEIPAQSTLEDHLKMDSHGKRVSWLLTNDAKQVVGIIPEDAPLDVLARHMPTATLGEIARKDFILVSEDAALFDVMDLMNKHHASVALVTRTGGSASADNVRGLITHRQIADCVTQATDVCPAPPGW